MEEREDNFCQLTCEVMCTCSYLGDLFHIGDRQFLHGLPLLPPHAIAGRMVVGKPSVWKGEANMHRPHCSSGNTFQNNFHFWHDRSLRAGI